jgi:hypothetical protein
MIWTAKKRPFGQWLTGARNGSQRTQAAPDPPQPDQAVDPAQRLNARLPPTVPDLPELHGMQKVRGSNPLSFTLSFTVFRVCARSLVTKADILRCLSCQTTQGKLHVIIGDVTRVVHVPYVVEQDEDGVWCACAPLRPGVALNTADLQVLDEHRDAGPGVGPADAGVVEPAVDAEGELAVGVGAERLSPLAVQRVDVGA